MKDYLASTGDVNGNWDRLQKLILNVFDSVNEDSSSHLIMLRELADDYQAPPIREGLIPYTYLGFKRAPAAKGNHHAYEGGLVYHLLEMWGCWLGVRNNCYAEGYVDNIRILKAILYHDIHKAYRTFWLVNSSPWQADYGADRSDTLMTADTKSLWILGQHGIKLDELQMNALLLAEGGYSKIKPKEQSVLAKMAYLLDEMSGNVISRIETGTLVELRKPVEGFLTK